MNFTEYIGQEILIMSPNIDPQLIQRVRLMGVESGGLWIESQKLTGILLKGWGMPAINKVIAFFIPYHQIVFATVAIPGVSLSEKSLGV
jgi:hypothetical protein